MNRPETTQDRPRGLIADFHGEKPPAPDWFKKALAVKPERTVVKSNGSDLDTLMWGERGKPGLMFLHGNGAHAEWWSFIAPMFAKDFRVVAYSMAGMGKSAWRETYDYKEMVDDVLNVMNATGLRDAPLAPVFIGHSFGSIVGSGVAAREEAKVRAVILLDGPMHSKHVTGVGGAHVIRPRKIYRSVEDALVRFRFSPEQPNPNPFIIDWIARTSLAKVKDKDGHDGWVWSADPEFWRKFKGLVIEDNFKALKYPIASIGAAKSHFADGNVAEIWRPHLQPGAPIIRIPNTHHHVMADEPLALVSALRMLFAAWPPVKG